VIALSLWPDRRDLAVDLEAIIARLFLGLGSFVDDPRGNAFELNKKGGGEPGRPGT